MSEHKAVPIRMGIRVHGITVWGRGFLVDLPANLEIKIGEQMNYYIVTEDGLLIPEFEDYVPGNSPGMQPGAIQE